MHAAGLVVLMISIIFLTEANEFSPPRPLENPQDISQILFKELGKGQTTFVTSQPTLTTAMALLALGSGDKTRQQILKGMDLFNDNSFLSGYASAILLRALKTGDKSWYDYDASIAMYVHKGVTLQPQFKNMSSTYFDAFLSEVDFQNDLKAAEKFINNNMYETTHHKIMDILSEGTITKDSELVLVSGVYFKGHWKYQFTPAGNRTFQSSKKNMIPMMRVQGQFEVADLPGGVRALRIPFDNEIFSMWVFLPSNSSGYAKLRNEFSNNTWTHVESKKKLSNVEVILPKFQIEFSTVYNSALRKLGIIDAFIQSANFSSIINPGPPLKLTSVVQKVVLETSEEGEEPFSEKTSADMQQFWVNQSFVFAIVGDNAYEWPLFVGSYSGKPKNVPMTDAVTTTHSSLTSRPHKNPDHHRAGNSASFASLGVTPLVLLLVAVLVTAH